MNYALQRLEEEFQESGALKVELPIHVARLMNRLIILDKEIVRLSKEANALSQIKKWLLILNASYNSSVLSFFYQKYRDIFSFYAINKHLIAEVHRDKVGRDSGIITFKRRML